MEGFNLFKCYNVGYIILNMVYGLEQRAVKRIKPCAFKVPARSLRLHTLRPTAITVRRKASQSAPFCMRLHCADLSRIKQPCRRRRLFGGYRCASWP